MLDEMGMDLNKLTIDDCRFMHNVLGLDIICEDGRVVCVADPEIDVKDCKDCKDA